jgi:hypothetical protein
VGSTRIIAGTAPPVPSTPSRALCSSAASVADVPDRTKPRRDRQLVAATLIDFEAAKREMTSQRQFARNAGVPRSTLQEWISRKEGIQCDREVVLFCESPVGLQFLHRITTAAQLTFNKCGPAGNRQMSQFLELSGLGHFVASSYGSVHKAATAMDDNIIAYGDQQRRALAAEMPRKTVSVCEDETFFPHPCLVAIEPVSGFIFLEQYSDKRDAESWNRALQASIEDLPVDVVQAVSDEAKGLISHAANGLGVHHSPDLFHGQHEVYKGTGPAMRATLRRAQNRVDEAAAAVQERIEERDEYKRRIDERGPGRPPNFEVRIAAANEGVAAAREELRDAQALEERLNAQVRGIGLDYHPVDLATGEPKQTKDVAAQLEERFEELHAIADELDLSENARKHIEKAQRLIPQMVATIAFFWRMVATVLTGSTMPKEVLAFLQTHLLPLAYLELVQAKVRGKQREVVRAAIAKLKTTTQTAASPLAALDERTRAMALDLAKQCAELFQRSSSCVEGRNGALSLHHHAGRSLTPRRLRVLQIIHNFGIRRADGTTAAKRLSGIEQPHLFEWLLERQPLPARPARPSSSRTAKRAS